MTGVNLNLNLSLQYQYFNYFNGEQKFNIKEKLIKEYPLTKKIEYSFECYEVIERRYVIFYDKKINKANIESLLDVFDDNFNDNTKGIFTEKKTLIIVGFTDEWFDKKDLLFFNGVDTFIVYYLINEKNNEIYFNDQRVFFFSID